MASQLNSNKVLEKNLHIYMGNNSKKIVEKRTISNLFYETTIILIPKPDKDTSKIYRPISLININTKVINIILAKCI